MARFDSADLLQRTKRVLNRPATDEAFTASTADDILYEFLGMAQDHVMSAMASIAPESMYGDLTLLTTSDDGQSWVFGTDADSAAIIPYGHFELYPTLNSYPDAPLVEGVDFMFEQGKIKALYGQTIEGPYGKWVTPPHLLNASVAPILKPLEARILLVYKAAEWAAEQRLKQSGDPYRAAYNEQLPRILLRMRTSAYGQGGRASKGSTRSWYQSGDLG